MLFLYFCNTKSCHVLPVTLRHASKRRDSQRDYGGCDRLRGYTMGCDRCILDAGAYIAAAPARTQKPSDTCVSRWGNWCTPCGHAHPTSPPRQHYRRPLGQLVDPHTRFALTPVQASTRPWNGHGVHDSLAGEMLRCWNLGGTGSGMQPRRLSHALTCMTQRH